jgi:hypothetical protein
MHELHEPQVRGKGNPDTGNSEITRSAPNNSELLELSFPPIPCEQCGKPFERRKHGGGSPQRFCSQDCRSAFHSDAQRGERSPACTLEAAVIDPAPEKSPEDAPEGNSEFDWNDTESVVLHEQPRTAVYWNTDGQLIIRQYNWPDDDSVILIASNSIDEFIDKLTDLCGVPSVGKGDSL